MAALFLGEPEDVLKYRAHVFNGFGVCARVVEECPDAFETVVIRVNGRPVSRFTSVRPAVRPESHPRLGASESPTLTRVSAVPGPSKPWIRAGVLRQLRILARVLQSFHVPEHCRMGAISSAVPLKSRIGRSTTSVSSMYVLEQGG